VIFIPGAPVQAEILRLDSNCGNRSQYLMALTDDFQLPDDFGTYVVRGKNLPLN